MQSARLTIVNRLGLHARAAARFVGGAKAFESKVLLEYEDRRVDAKSIMNVMLLAAPMGNDILLQVDGPDEDEAFVSLKALIESGFGEGVDHVC